MHILHTLRQPNQNLDNVYVCTGDIEIINQCKKLNINYIKATKHSNGTERCYEAAQTLSLKNNDTIINIQETNHWLRKKI